MTWFKDAGKKNSQNICCAIDCGLKKNLFADIFNAGSRTLKKKNHLNNNKKYTFHCSTKSRLPPNQACGIPVTGCYILGTHAALCFVWLHLNEHKHNKKRASLVHASILWKPIRSYFRSWHTHAKLAGRCHHVYVCIYMHPKFATRADGGLWSLWENKRFLLGQRAWQHTHATADDSWV